MSEFDRCSGWIAAALEYAGGTHDVEDVRDAVRDGRMQLWPGEAACIVTEVVRYPKLKAARLFCGGGDLDELRLMEESVSAWARLIGCDRLEGFGRAGWARELKRQGYDETRVFAWRSL